MLTENNTGEKRRTLRSLLRRTWFRVLAFILALAMLFSIWAGSAVQIKIQAENEHDAAAQYLIDNTEYISQEDVERLRDIFKSYRQAVDAADFYQLAGTQIAKGEYEDALGSIEKCLELDTGEDKRFHQDLLLKKGCLNVLLGRYTEAAEVLEELLLEDPENAEAYLVMAQIYAETGNTGGLSLVLGEYLKLRPDDGEIMLLQAQLMFENGQYEEALNEYESLLESGTMAGSEAELKFLSALAHIQLGSYQQARDILLALDQEDSDIEGLDYYIGVCHMSCEEYLMAVESFGAAIEAGDMLQLSSYSRGVCRMTEICYDFDGAVQDLERAANYDGDDRDEGISQQAQNLLDTISAAIAEQQERLEQ